MKILQIWTWACMMEILQIWTWACKMKILQLSYNELHVMFISVFCQVVHLLTEQCEKKQKGVFFSSVGLSKSMDKWKCSSSTADQTKTRWLFFWSNSGFMFCFYIVPNVVRLKSDEVVEASCLEECNVFGIIFQSSDSQDNKDPGLVLKPTIESTQ